jgi:hypothetical protein
LVKTPETNRDVLTTELVKSLGPTTKVQITGLLNIPETTTQVLTKGWYNPWGRKDALTVRIINTLGD